jgi:hypothetical protein
MTTKDATDNLIANMRQEIARLQAINSDLLAACEAGLFWITESFDDDDELPPAAKKLSAALAKAKP